MRRALRVIITAAVVGLTVLISTSAAYACPPWFFYQPKAPRSLIR